MKVQFEITEEMQELVAIEELKLAYKMNYEQDPQWRDEELLFALSVVLEYFMGIPAYKEWEEQNK